MGRESSRRRQERKRELLRKLGEPKAKLDCECFEYCPEPGCKNKCLGGIKCEDSHLCLDQHVWHGPGR